MPSNFSSAAGSAAFRTSRRRCLALGAGTLAAASFPALAIAPPAVSVLAFGADASGQRDSSAAFAAAFAKSSSVTVPAGRFLAGNVEMRPGWTLRGEGDASVLVQRPGSAAILHLESGSTRADAGAAAIVIGRLQLRGACDTQGFAEHVHLLTLQGASNVTIEDVLFNGFQGDGLYLGAVSSHNEERHNSRIVVRHCVFDGINQSNRNAISVIDCDGLSVTDCEFRNCSRADMPGAIDIEPNANRFTIVHHLLISGNRFTAIGGGIGAISMYIPILLDTMPSDIVIENNTLHDVAKAAFSLRQNVPPPEGAGLQGIVVRKNRVDGKSLRPFEVRGLNGVEFADNEFTDAAESALIGARDDHSAVRNFTLRGNQFQRSGQHGGVGITVFDARTLQVVDNTFVDCGNGAPTSYVFDFNAGRTDHVTFERNRFLSPHGRSRYAIQKEAGHRFDGSTNRFAADNKLDDGLKNAFESAKAP